MARQKLSVLVHFVVERVLQFLDGNMGTPRLHYHFIVSELFEVQTDTEAKSGVAR